jgi:preprotein translocase subunit SecG
MLHTLLMIIHFFCAAAIVSLVLLQRGKGADAGAGFGAGASGTVFGARGASTALSRATAILAGIFMVTSLSLAYVGARKSAAPASLLDQLSQQVPAGTVPSPGTVAAPAPDAANAPNPAPGAVAGDAGALDTKPDSPPPAAPASAPGSGVPH